MKKLLKCMGKMCRKNLKNVFVMKLIQSKKMGGYGIIISLIY